MIIFSHTNPLLVLLLFVTFTNAENVDDENQTDDNGTASLESESNEAYNASSKEKPDRLKYQDIKVIDNNYMKTSMKYFPFAVSIQKKGSHYASGALIDKRWILTAAGPFYSTRESIKLLKVRLGSVNCKKGGTVVPLKEIVIHPSYINMEPTYDLALLKIGQPIKFSEFILPIPLATMKGKILSAKFQSTYWSRLIINHKLLPSTAKERIQQNSLRVSTQDMIPQEKCVDLLQKYNYTFSRSTLCLGPIVSHHSPCTPDVGAPITANDRLWGITSGWTSKDCLQNISPTVFNRVSFPLTGKWIESTINIF
ncbi:unnamed protein product, partial [Brenthis ino]